MCVEAAVKKLSPCVWESGVVQRDPVSVAVQHLQGPARSAHV